VTSLLNLLFEKRLGIAAVFILMVLPVDFIRAQTQKSIYFDIKGNKVESQFAATRLTYTISSNGEIKGWAQHKIEKTPFTEEYLLHEILLTDTSGANFEELRAIQLIYFEKGLMSTKYISTLSGGQSIEEMYRKLSGRFYKYEKNKLKTYAVLANGRPVTVYRYDNFEKITSINDHTMEEEGYAEIIYRQSNQFWEKCYEADFTGDDSDIPFTRDLDIPRSNRGVHLQVSMAISYSNLFQSPMPLGDLSNITAELEFNGGSSFFGFIFGAQTGTGNSWKFCIDPQGFYEIMKLYNGQSVALPLRGDRLVAVRDRMYASDYQEALKQGLGYSDQIKKTGVNILSVRLYNGQIIFFINGIEVERLRLDIFGNYVGIVGDRTPQGQADCFIKSVSVSNTLFAFDPYKLEEDIRSSAGSASGTGFLVNAQGLILTNYHVVQSAKSIYVLHNNRYQACKLIGFDKERDLALIKPISYVIPKARPLAFRFDGPQLAERIFVLGYPSSVELGTNVKVTDGIISSLNTNGLYQISSPIQPGNSGSPLLDMMGRVVGVVNAGIPTLDNVGFSITAKQVQHFIHRMGVTVPVASSYDNLSFEQLVHRTKESVFYIKVDF